ncbi:hypothetical protein TEA_017306 [Camellia sinensis var. sinensis]|uniref:Uncharacterized protein n=1 Tax=Camellia sinensis var. sinensis TaxID=542762 RepID=A0A4S4EE71_CAMSN|nr:hypothetical protein TEA_017306 [Camellia sinensis var. sinensis]
MTWPSDMGDLAEEPWCGRNELQFYACSMKLILGLSLTPNGLHLLPRDCHESAWGSSMYRNSWSATSLSFMVSKLVGISLKDEVDPVLVIDGEGFGLLQWLRQWRLRGRDGIESVGRGRVVVGSRCGHSHRQRWHGCAVVVVAAYLLAVLGGNTSPCADDLNNILNSVGAEADDDRIQLLLSEVKGKDITELITSTRGFGFASARGEASVGFLFADHVKNRGTSRQLVKLWWGSSMYRNSWSATSLSFMVSKLVGISLYLALLRI